MKALCIAILFLGVLFTISASANTIDGLKTKDDVQKFLIEKVDTYFRKESIFYSKGSVGYAKDSFMKLDFNGDGRTDLLIIGPYQIVVIDNGHENYKRIFIGGRGALFSKYELTDVVYLNETPLLVITTIEKNRIRFDEDDKPMEAKSVRLIFKFNNFIEYNPSPDTFAINELSFSTDGCFGSCPNFDMTIVRNRLATFNNKYVFHWPGEKNENGDTGKFTTIIDSAAFAKLTQTVRYMNVKELKQSYFVGWTDDATGDLKMTLNDGPNINVSDYGMIGTYGLENLYEQIYDLRKSQKWVK